MWGTKHVFHVNLVQIPRYFIHKQKPQTDGMKNRTFHSSLRVVTRKRDWFSARTLQTTNKFSKCRGNGWCCPLAIQNVCHLQHASTAVKRFFIMWLWTSTHDLDLCTCQDEPACQISKGERSSRSKVIARPSFCKQYIVKKCYGQNH